MLKILVVEDEVSIANLLKLTLSKEGYTVKIAEDGLVATNIIDKEQFDLILLDIMIPKIDGFELIPYIKEKEIPVIFTTAISDINSKLKGFNLGADDYITKPFEIKELLARVRVVLRRNNKLETKYKYKNIEIDYQSRTVKKDGKVVSLTKKEYDLLILLIQNKNVALYREIIYERLWNDEYDKDTRTVDLHIQRIRKKLNLEKEIETIFKIGYRFTERI